MKKLFVFLICIVIAACSAAKHIDLSGVKLYGYKPDTTFQKERKSPLAEQKMIGENTLLAYEDGISFLVTPDHSILSIEAPSELEPMESRDGIQARGLRR